jgi:hypothetical protein
MDAYRAARPDYRARPKGAAVEGISNYLRLRATAVAAFVAAGLVLTAMCASASANVFLKRISLGIRNSSKTAIHAQVCRNLSVSARYEEGLQQNPCVGVPPTYTIRAGDVKIISNANPVGVIITNAVPFLTGDRKDERTLYFSASNESLRRPFFRMGGLEIPMSEGHAETWGSYHGVGLELRRYHDEDRDGESVKLMRIEIRSWPGLG